MTGPSHEKEDILDILLGAKKHLMPLPTLIELEGRTLIIGDLHADLECATRAIRKFNGGSYDNLIFLGDYIDRGEENVATMDLILRFMLDNGHKVHLLRGNHEVRWVNNKQGLRYELEEKGMAKLHRTYNEVFCQMPVAALIDKKVLATHGGVPEGLPDLTEIKEVQRDIQDPDEEEDVILTGLMWNDPSNGIEGFVFNEKRGRAKLFGRQAFNDFMVKNDLKSMVRGHQRWIGGYRYFFDKRLLSVFSSKSYSTPIQTKAAIVDKGQLEVSEL